MKAVSFSIILLVAVCVNSVRAQDQGSVGSERPAVVSAPNAIYVELLGSGLIYSINYDRMITDYFGARIGIGYLPDGSLSLTTIPITASLFPFGASTSKLEIGAGVVQASLGSTKVGKTTGGTYLGYVGILGYRLEPSDGGFLFRLAFTPFILNGHFQPYAGISFGFAF